METTAADPRNGIKNLEFKNGLKNEIKKGPRMVGWRWHVRQDCPIGAFPIGEGQQIMVCYLYTVGRIYVGILSSLPLWLVPLPTIKEDLWLEDPPIDLLPRSSWKDPLEDPLPSKAHRALEGKISELRLGTQMYKENVQGSTNGWWWSCHIEVPN